MSCTSIPVLAHDALDYLREAIALGGALRWRPVFAALHDDLDGPLATVLDGRHLHDSLQRAKDDGLGHVILDGRIFAADRLGEKAVSVKGEWIDLWYPGEAREPGGDIPWH